jgi:addiction module HigA family antidote
MPLTSTTSRRVRPTHPGEMLREDFMPDYNLSITALAKAMGVSRQSVNELVQGRRAVSPAMALRLARVFGNTPEFWLNGQRAVDLWDAQKRHRKSLDRIKQLDADRLSAHH